MEKILKAKDVGEWLEIDVQRVYELTRRGLLPSVKMGDRQYRYLESQIEKWLQSGGNNEINEHSLRSIARQNSESAD